jgi:NAD(P)-dependent dehydrogenase (short-subunit alcohol dehydrogenase family)
MAGGVVITGVSSGIGRAAALDLDRRGFRVFGGVRRQEDADGLKREASDRFTPLVLDVTDADALARARTQVEEGLGDEPLAGVVNNAGVGAGGPIEALDIDELRRTLEVNAIAPVAVTQAFIPRLRASRGRVVNISSIGGRVSQPFLGPYSASKFALEALSDVMRRELRQWGIHVALIEPGNVKTRIWEKGQSQVDDLRASAGEEIMERYGASLDRMETFIKLAQRRGVEPEKVAKAITHALTSGRPRARYVIGVDARVQLAMEKGLPTRATDRLFGKMMGS